MSRTTKSITKPAATTKTPQHRRANWKRSNVRTIAAKKRQLRTHITKQPQTTTRTMSTNPAYAMPAQKPPHHNSSSAGGSGVVGASGVNMASGESKISINQKPAAHTSLDVSGTTTLTAALTTSTSSASSKVLPAVQAANGQNWTDELDSPLWLSSLHSVIFIITCALAVFILFRNVLTW